LKDNPIIPWLEILLDGLEAEFHNRNRIAALATVDSAGQPHVRSIICRRFGPDGSVAFATDRTSEKIAQIRSNSRAELMFWLPGWREQYRLCGLLEEVKEPLRSAIWTEMSDKSRALFFWPAPAQPREPTSAFVEFIPSATPPPQRFLVLLLVPDQVERLELNDHPHHRRRWRKDTEWEVEEINP
jgi:PPOX class probable FMN-dependent enzyme